MTATDIPRDFFARIPELAALPVETWQVRPLAGLTNRSLRVTAGNLDYVLRLPGAAAGQYLSRAAELRNARLAATIDLAPPVLFADAALGVMLLPYLPDSRHLTVDDMKSPAVVARVAAVLARLHGSGLQFEGAMAAFPIIDRYLAIGSDDRLRALRARIAPLQAMLTADPMPASPCHIDPNPANFLHCADGRLRLIDWEFSAMCEPIWDLAGVSIEGRLDPAAEEHLLASYERGGIAVPRIRFRVLKTALHLVAATWAKAELVAGAARPEIAAVLDDHCAALETALTDPGLARLLEKSA